MNELESSSLRKIEARMQHVDPDSLRYHVLEQARLFKSSWIELGRALYTVRKEKRFKEWGYSSFDTYTAKEIGIRKQTAVKLLMSYYFLEKEEPEYLGRYEGNTTAPSLVPSYESVNVLRLAKNRSELGENEYAGLRKAVFGSGKDAVTVRKELTELIKQREEDAPEEARKKKRVATLKRFLSSLKTIKRDIESLKFLPRKLVDETDRLIRGIESELSK